MEPKDLQFLREFYNAVNMTPIEFDGKDDKRYVPLYKSPELVQHDPVKLLARPIEFTPGQTVQLFSGFRGSGKSTELRRLRQYLNGRTNYKVVLCDIEDYLNLSQPVDVSDFLMAVADAFGEGLFKEGHLLGDPVSESYWTRFANFLQRTHINLSEFSASGTAPTPVGNIPLGVKAALKSDPSFRQKLQARMSGHLGALVEDVRSYVQDCVKKVKQRFGPDTEVVLIVDSMEHIRGSSISTASAVQDSVVNLFTTHSDKLHFHYLHVVYTIPPYLKVLYGGLGGLYAPGGVQVLPTLKVRDRQSGQPFRPGLDLLENLLSARGNWKRLLGPERTTVEQLSLLSGGHLRDFLRMIAEIIRRTDELPVSESTFNTAIEQIRSEFLPITNADAVWLARIAETHDVSLPDHSKMHDLARFFDTHLALCYRNGVEWYDVHPLVRDVVKKQAASVAAQRPEKE